MPKVSVLIATYNRAELLRQALTSVAEQTYKDVEVIVVDDGSTDHTAEVVASFRSIIDALHYVPQVNAGRSRARNAGISLARGEYVAFLDSDDLWLPQKLERQVEILDRYPDCGLVYSSARVIDDQGREVAASYDAPVSGWIYPDVAFYVPVTILLPTVVVRTAALRDVGMFDPRMERFEDTDLWRRICARYRACAIREPLAKIRTHSENAISVQDPLRLLEQVDYYVRKVLDEDRGVVKWHVHRRGASRLYLHYGAAVLSQPGWGRLGDRFLFRSFRCWPLHGGALMVLRRRVGTLPKRGLVGALRYLLLGLLIWITPTEAAMEVRRRLPFRRKRA